MDASQPAELPAAIRNDPRALRLLIRAGGYAGRTGGLAMGYVQANLGILPAADAADFLRYCQRNPKPCPLLAVGEPGDPRLPQLGDDLDLRSDLPSYRVWRDGVLADTVTDIAALWRDDLVGFALGCSYSFEEALLEGGLRLRHVEQGLGPARYVSSIPTVPAGRFGGAMVVTMRPFRPADAIRAIQITSRFPMVHGAPVHIGLPHLIGITDLAGQCESPFIPVPDDEIPLFWACGVTPENAVRAARPPFCITHTPAHMLITDLRNASLATG
jgi:uncharacterized protein YcsI (UPF0317 family)